MLSFAGKVRISTGLTISEEQLEQETTLKILASPKLPSPSLYFRNKIGPQTYIAKHDLNPKDHQAKGREQYLHALRQINNPENVQKLSPTGNIANSGVALFPWESGNNDHQEQKVKIKPIKTGTEFEFNVDFDNLTAWELGLLCYAIKPSEHYRHKLGMGKPIGLGTVNISIEKLELIDRQQRYGEDTLDAERYNDQQLDVDTLRNSFIATMDADVHRALELIGDPHNVKAPVHYPQVYGQNIENETYRWFVANDHGRNQIMEPISSTTEQLPQLSR
jgi:CRISPR-associated protein (TIGR03986 family)